MTENSAPPDAQARPLLMIGLGYYAVFGCAVFAMAIGVADMVVPDHDWIADTISDLGAGRFEFIVDIGIYTFSSAILAVALLAAHVHMGGTRWTLGLLGLALLALIVFLVGARNEYGDRDTDGVVIHRYLVYALGLLMAAIPALMAKGLSRSGVNYGRALWAISGLWVVSAPDFFFLPTDLDGLYERYLGLVAFALITTLALFFIRRGRQLQRLG